MADVECLETAAYQAAVIWFLRAIYGNDSDVIMMHGLADLTDENDIRPEWGRYLLDAVDRYLYKAPDVLIKGHAHELFPEPVIHFMELWIHHGHPFFAPVKHHGFTHHGRGNGDAAAVHDEFRRVPDVFRVKPAGTGFIDYGRKI